MCDERRTVKVDVEKDGVVVRVAGPLPSPDPDELRRALNERGLGGVDVKLTLVLETQVDLSGR